MKHSQDSRLNSRQTMNLGLIQLVSPSVTIWISYIIHCNVTEYFHYRVVIILLYIFPLTHFIGKEISLIFLSWFYWISLGRRLVLFSCLDFHWIFLGKEISLIFLSWFPLNFHWEGDQSYFLVLISIEFSLEVLIVTVHKLGKIMGHESNLVSGEGEGRRT